MTPTTPINTQNAYAVTYVKTCPDSKKCKHIVTDSTSLGKKLQELTFSAPLPNRVKVSIAACRRCCTEPFVRDVGVIASRNGWAVVFGGNGGGRPRIADILTEGLDEDEVVDLVKKSVEFYIQNAKPKQRTARFIESFGIDHFKNQVLTRKN